MTYGEERLHFPDNLKPEKKSSKGWILIFMVAWWVLIIVVIWFTYYQLQHNKYFGMDGKVVKGEDVISTVQDAIDENELICIEVVTLGGIVTFLHTDRTGVEESGATLDAITKRGSQTYVDPVSRFGCSVGHNATGTVDHICFMQK